MYGIKRKADLGGKEATDRFSQLGSHVTTSDNNSSTVLPVRKKNKMTPLQFKTVTVIDSINPLFHDMESELAKLPPKMELYRRLSDLYLKRYLATGDFVSYRNDMKRLKEHDFPSDPAFGLFPQSQNYSHWRFDPVSLRMHCSSCKYPHSQIKDGVLHPLIQRLKDFNPDFLCFKGHGTEVDIHIDLFVHEHRMLRDNSTDLKKIPVICLRLRELGNFLSKLFQDMRAHNLEEDQISRPATSKLFVDTCYGGERKEVFITVEDVIESVTLCCLKSLMRLKNRAWYVYCDSQPPKEDIVEKDLIGYTWPGFFEFQKDFNEIISLFESFLPIEMRLPR
jgi:hypothetical protein